MNELVSAIITTYKRPISVLNRSIDSVLRQTYNNVELIIVNDNPEDGELAKAIQMLVNERNSDKVRVRYVSYEENKGACFARNVGIMQSKGHFIAFLDDDDAWCEDKTELQVKAFQSNPEIGMVYCSFVNIKSNKKEVRTYSKETGQLYESVLRRNIIGGCSMPMIKRTVFDDVGLFDESFKSSQDYDMWLRISTKYEIGFVDKVLVIRYQLPESITLNSAKRIQGWEQLTNKHYCEYLKHPELLKSRTADYIQFLCRIGEFKRAYNWMRRLKQDGIDVFPCYYRLAYGTLQGMKDKIGFIGKH